MTIVFDMALAAPTASSTASFLMGRVSGAVAWLALFDGGQLLIRALRPLLAILWLSLGVFLPAIAPLIAAAVPLGAWPAPWFVAFPGLAPRLLTIVPVIAARFSVPIASRIALPGFHRFRDGFRLAGQPAKYLFQDRRLRYFPGRRHGRRLSRRDALYGRLWTLDFWFLC